MRYSKATMGPFDYLIPTLLRPFFDDEGNVDWIEDATQGSFLKHAGEGSLSRLELAYFLSQETHLMRAYVRFASRLLSLIRLPHVSREVSSGARTRTVEDHHALQQVIDMLCKCLGQTQREQELLKAVARDYSLPHGLVDFGEPDMNEHTRRYHGFLEQWAKGGSLNELFERLDEVMADREQGRKRLVEGGSGGRSSVASDASTAVESMLSETSQWRVRLLLGVLVLWVLEWCRYCSWKYTKPWTLKQRIMESGDNLAAHAVKERLIPYWTGSDFRAIVVESRNAVDELGRVLAVEEDENLMTWLNILIRRNLTMMISFFDAIESQYSFA